MWLALFLGSLHFSPFIGFLPSLILKFWLLGVFVQFRLFYLHSMRQELGGNPLIKVEVKIFRFGLCPVEVSIGHIGWWTCVHHPTCPVEIFIGHKPCPRSSTFLQVLEDSPRFKVPPGSKMWDFPCISPQIWFGSIYLVAPSTGTIYKGSYLPRVAQDNLAPFLQFL